MTDDWIERRNPAFPGQVVGVVRVATPARVEEVVRAAAAAQVGWAARPVWARAEVLRQAAAQAEGGIELWAETLTRELGKPLAEARGEIGFALMALRWFCDQAVETLVDDEVDDDRGRLLLRKRPYGVVAAVTPWNAPVILSMLKVAPALLAGNACVVKPSPLAPLAVDQLIESLGQRLPTHLLATVQGGAETGAALVGNPGVHKVAFTGGSTVGRAIAHTAAEALTPSVLELGGNDAAIFLPDADLPPSAMARTVVASFATSGQVCMAAKRLYVHRSRIDDFVTAYRAAAEETLVVGDPMAPATTLGPVVTREAQLRLLELVGASAASGTAYELGTVPDADVVAGGWFVRPTLVLGLDDGHALVAEEQFGPVVPVLAYDSEDEVVARANAGELGLGASVWSGDEEHAFDVARRLDAGFTFINTHNRTGMALRAPFGGVKRSGWGREYGTEGLLEYVQTCAIHAPAAFRPGADSTGTDSAGAGAASAYPTA